MVSTVRPYSTIPSSIDRRDVIEIGRRSAITHLGASGNVPRIVKNDVICHCIIWSSSARWYIQDVGSDIGTFLNCVRLSQPNTESRIYLLRNGDKIQLGQRQADSDAGVPIRSFVVRFEGSDSPEPEIVTSVRKQRGRESQKHEESVKRPSNDCKICLTPILQSQASLAAPCDHVWHYGCIQRFVQATSIRAFLCPICLEHRLSSIAFTSSSQRGKHSQLWRNNFLPKAN